MELLIIDPFDSMPIGTLYNNLPVTRYIRGFSGDAGIGSVANHDFRIFSGILSERMIGMSINSSSGNKQMTIDTKKTQSSGKSVWGFHFKYTNDVSSEYRLIHIPLGENGYEKIILQDNVISFLDQSNLAPLNENGWNHIEVVIDLNGNTFKVYINDEELLSGSHSYSFIRNLFHWSQEVNLNYRIYYDNIYHLGGTVGPFNDRLGPTKVTRMPLSSATETEFIPEGTALNITAVNKDNLSTTTYNTSPEENNKRDMFKVDTSRIRSDQDIIAVSHQLLYRKQDVGKRNLSAVAELGGNKEYIALPENLALFGGHEPLILTEKPGGGAWTKADLGNTEFGYEVKE